MWKLDSPDENMGSSMDLFLDSAIPPIKTKLGSCLLIDDSIPSRRMMAKILSNFFEEIYEANDGVEGLQTVKYRLNLSKTYDYIFIDQEMPNLLGHEAISHIRKLNYAGPIISITGYVECKDIHDKIIASGANKVLSKPLRLDTIANILNEGEFLLR